MNDITLTQLKIIVERAVRPVRARSSRLRRMREDLLAHAVAVFEEEFEQWHDEQAAARRVEQRMGDANVLSRRLQESVPVTELLTWRFEHLLRMRHGERPIRRAARHGLLMFLTLGTVLLVIVVPILVAQDRTRELPLLLAITIVHGGLGFAFTLLTHGMREALYRSSARSWCRAILLGATSCLSIFAGMGLFCLTALHDARPVLTDPVLLRSTLALAVLSPIGLIALAWQTAKDIRYAEEWGSLQIGD